MNTTAISPKIGFWKGGFLLTRASWSTLKISPEVIWIQLIAALVGTLIIAGMAVLVWLLSGLPSIETWGQIFNAHPWLWGMFIVAEFVISMIVGNFFSVAMVWAVLQRFNGTTPTVKSSLEAAWTKRRAIAEYSLFFSTIGMLFQLIESEINKLPIPFLGRLFAQLTVMLTQVTIGLVNIFAIPVIVANDSYLSPLQTIKRSASTFKKVWGYEVTANFGFTALGLAFILPLMSFAFTAAVMALEYGPYTLFVTLPVFLVWMICGMVLLNSFNMIFYAALFRFAETGESPAQFDKNLLIASMKPKKKWFV